MVDESSDDTAGDHQGMLINILDLEKVTVNGDNAHPVFTLGKSAFEGDVSWNFAGIFLFDKEGECVGRYDAKALKELKEQVASALA